MIKKNIYLLMLLGTISPAFGMNSKIEQLRRTQQTAREAQRSLQLGMQHRYGQGVLVNHDF